MIDSPVFWLAAAAIMASKGRPASAEPRASAGPTSVGRPGTFDAETDYGVEGRSSPESYRGISIPGWYGKSWKNTRPPGLPSDAPCCGEEGSARDAIYRMALEVSGGQRAFSETMVALGDNESSCTFARPANNFNNLPSSQRGGKGRITAWGAFQFNYGAIGRLDRYGILSPADAKRHAWQFTPDGELRFPILQYVAVAHGIRAAGGGDREITHGIWLFHSGPAYESAWKNARFSPGWWENYGSDSSDKLKASETESKAARKQSAQWG